MSSDPTSLYSRKNPFPATHPVNRKLSGEGSGKDTRHHEISLAGSGLHYEVGDSMGLFATNDPELVNEIIVAIGATGEESVPGADGQPKSLRAALTSDYIITQPSKEFLKAIVEKATPALADLRDLSGDPAQKKALEDYLWGLEYIDFLLDHHTVKWGAEEFVKTLRKLQPRLYSIASSLKANPESVHLTVATVRYESHGRKRKGVASTFLAERWGGDQTGGVFIHTAKHFRLPEDTNTPVIMVGPGTGVAPFRAYIQERKVTGAKGKNWLFFGEQTRSKDFLYEQELVALQADGVLNKLDVAFSRDQAQKIYVQDKMRENAAEMWAWLQEGAHFYVCGDGARMAKDVDTELHRIAESQGGKSPEEAAAYIEALKKEKRYKKDVY
ncbi:MAG: sulfite reductase subunit alpha [Chthoniobacter sp.]|uniref:sulfite reductase subunit alpha n=1 Tax=Chthoniobacter sp. TaxID=2510640 RepID=UPI0032A1D1C6